MDPLIINENVCRVVCSISHVSETKKIDKSESREISVLEMRLFLLYKRLCCFSTHRRETCVWWFGNDKKFKQRPLLRGRKTKKHTNKYGQRRRTFSRLEDPLDLPRLTRVWAFVIRGQLTSPFVKETNETYSRTPCIWPINTISLLLLLAGKSDRFSPFGYFINTRQSLFDSQCVYNPV